MRRYLAKRSLLTQLVCAALLCLVLTAIVVLVVLLLASFQQTLSGADLQVLRLRVIAAFAFCGLGTSLFMLATGAHLLRPLQRLREGMLQVMEGQLESNPAGPMPNQDLQTLKDAFDRMVAQLRSVRLAHEQSQQVLATRTRTVDRLLEFSQSIQGAGKPEQIFLTLCHSLHTELGLSGLVILSHEPDAMPALSVQAVYPPDLVTSDRPIHEMEIALCPALRANLPRHFRPDGAPVRCAIDSLLRLPSSCPAYCIPFTIGRRVQIVVHMLLAEGLVWSEELKHLAQTYVNAAASALIALQLLADAEQQSMTDPLTGLYNRRSLEKLMDREVALAERHSHALSLVMIDMDQFKQINDTHGHAAGDHMLRSFADCVRITLRKTDLAFRYGGDEFVIALPQTPIPQAQQVVQKIRQAFNAVDFSSAIAKLDHQPTLSIGVAERNAPQAILTMSQLLAAADAALYDAKNANRNCVRVYQPVKAA